MADQLLWFETLLKGSIGLLMLLFPIASAQVAGLPHGKVAFWSRLFGAALIGIAAAFALEGCSQINSQVTAKGIGLGGAVLINMVTLLSLIGTLIFNGVSSRRGQLLISGLCIVLMFLILFEIANA